MEFTLEMALDHAFVHKSRLKLAERLAGSVEGAAPAPQPASLARNFLL